VDIQPRILVIDTDPVTLTSVASVAAEEGFEVRTAVDADGAMRQCRSGYIDLVVIDAALDSRSGYGVLNSIRILKPSVRAVLLQGRNGSVEPFHRAEVIERVEKPLGLDRLHQLFARLRNESWHAPWPLSGSAWSPDATEAGMPLQR
jgi:DNA-binding NtrC family response regulator